eukprot:767191-Hanusia_phi.AAC.4
MTPAVLRLSFLSWRGAGPVTSTCVAPRLAVQRLNLQTELQRNTRDSPCSAPVGSQSLDQHQACTVSSLRYQASTGVNLFVTDEQTR